VAHLLNQPTAEQKILWTILWSSERRFNHSTVVFRPTVFFIGYASQVFVHKRAVLYVGKI